MYLRDTFRRMHFMKYISPVFTQKFLLPNRFTNTDIILFLKLFINIKATRVVNMIN